MPSAKPTFEAMFKDSFLDSDFFGPTAKTISFTITSGGTVDPVTGQVTGGSASFYSAKGYARDTEEKEFKEVLGGDMTFTCRQIDLGYTPEFDDVASLTLGEGTTFNGDYKVVEVKADGADVTYRIQLRR